jgi:hypothetical protein
MVRVFAAAATFIWVRASREVPTTVQTIGRFEAFVEII